jgi:hypothetical protein
MEACAQDVQRAVLEVLGRLSSAGEHAAHFKLFLSCRGDMSRIVPASFVTTYRQAVSLATIDADISAFVQESLQQKIADGDLALGSEELVTDIQQTLVSQADSM